jgi:hypothetical protein
MVKTTAKPRKALPGKNPGKQALELAKEEKFLQSLELADPEMTSSMALHSLHRFIRENEIPDLGSFQQKSAEILRICKICDKWDRIKNIETCYNCEDHFHRSCYKVPLDYDDDKFICYGCVYAQNPRKTCKVCTQVIGQNSKVTHCDYCKNEYHSKCTNTGRKICKRCLKVRGRFEPKAKQKQIRKDQAWTSKVKESNRNLRDMFELLVARGDKIVPNSDTRFPRKGCQFKTLSLLEGRKAETDKYRELLLKVIQAKGMKYTEDLKDIEFHFDNMEEGSMNFGLQNLSAQ